MAAGLLRCDRCGKIGLHTEINIQIWVRDLTKIEAEQNRINRNFMPGFVENGDKNLCPPCWELIKEQFNYQP